MRVKGTILFAQIKFSDTDTTAEKYFVVLADFDNEPDIILNRITKKDPMDAYSIEINPQVDTIGPHRLKMKSYIRVDKIYTIPKTSIKYDVCLLTPAKITALDNILRALFEI